MLAGRRSRKDGWLNESDLQLLSGDLPGGDLALLGGALIALGLDGLVGALAAIDLGPRRSATTEELRSELPLLSGLRGWGDRGVNLSATLLSATAESWRRRRI